MSFRLFDAPEREPSQFVGFAGNPLERDSEHRADDCVTLALQDAALRIVLMQNGRICLQKTEAGFTPWFTLASAASLGMVAQDAMLLGRDAQGPVVAALTTMEPEALPETVKAIDHRSVYVQGLLEASEMGVLAQGASLFSWHSTHKFCGRCGGKTEMHAGGYKRVCAECAAEHFPRTDPVAIMLTVTKDACMMGRGHHFAPGMYSALAGFIEPGESIEAAVRRETFEESGIRLGRVIYHASQPWPFPYSLMIGCFGEALNTDIHRDEAELEDCRWFDRDEVKAILAGSHPSVSVPPSGAIAHHLIRFWAENT